MNVSQYEALLKALKPAPSPRLRSNWVTASPA